MLDGSAGACEQTLGFVEVKQSTGSGLEVPRPQGREGSNPFPGIGALGVIGARSAFRAKVN